jgi:hypothetical protein
MIRGMMAPAHSLQRVGLRELGVYALPGGGEYVASTLYADGCCLYTPVAWQLFANADLWVANDGRILRRGQPTGWSVRDLKDTGRTARYPRPVIA